MTLTQCWYMIEGIRSYDDAERAEQELRRNENLDDREYTDLMIALWRIMRTL